MTCVHLTVRGECSKGLYGGRPSPGTCRICDDYDGPDRGLGDTVKRVVHASGAHKVAELYESVTKLPCGCKGRRRKLNEWYPSKCPETTPKPDYNEDAPSKD